ncbi:hypothetical protein ABIE49_003595 [Bradyrhizobium sp. OAE829]
MVVELLYRAGIIALGLMNVGLVAALLFAGG